MKKNVLRLVLMFSVSAITAAHAEKLDDFKEVAGKKGVPSVRHHAATPRAAGIVFQNDSSARCAGSAYRGWSAANLRSATVTACRCGSVSRRDRSPKRLPADDVTPALLDRVAGAPVTARNWRTVQALAALAAERD